MQKKLILAASKKMDDNRKRGRNEHTLIRMAETTRDYMQFYDDRVELWPVDSTGNERINNSILLKIFHAFQSDLDELKRKVASKEMSVEECKRVGFVTTRMFKKICGKRINQHDNIWISDDIHDTVLGADPEFLLFRRNNNKIVHACEVLPYIGEMGSDGPMAEIRPKPEVAVEAIVKNITDIFNHHSSISPIGGYKWEANCYHYDGQRYYPVGGHIHIGTPLRIATYSYDFKHSLYNVMNKVLDEFLTIPFIRMDGSNGSIRRDCNIDNCGYGDYGDFRIEAGRLEHRSLSGMWLLHPSISRAVFGTVKAVIEQIFKLVITHKLDANYILPQEFHNVSLWNKFNRWEEIPLTNDMQCITSSIVMRKNLAKSDPKSVSNKLLTDRHNILKTFSSYKNHSQYVDAFYEILKINRKEISAWDHDIRNNWLEGKKFIVDI